MLPARQQIQVTLANLTLSHCGRTRWVNIHLIRLAYSGEDGGPTQLVFYSGKKYFIKEKADEFNATLRALREVEL